MAKRFTDTDIWNKSWYRKLSPKMKCFWSFITDRCCIAGIWDQDFESASFHIGQTVKLKEVLAAFGGRLHAFEDKILVVPFVDFQYGKLKENAPVHAKVLARLEKFGFHQNTLHSTLPSTLENRVEEEEEEEVKEEEEEKEEEEVRNKRAKISKISDWSGLEFFYDSWMEWLEYKKAQFRFTYKLESSEKKAFKQAFELSDSCSVEFASLIDNAIAKGWKGIYKTKNENTESTNDRITRIALG